MRCVEHSGPEERTTVGKSGWCLSGHHKVCPVEFKQWKHGVQGKGRKAEEVIVYTGVIHVCGCPCHKKGKKK